jgi:hypothetical protein
MSDFNEWFCGLPEGRQKVLREDKWALAAAAFDAMKAERDALSAAFKKVKSECVTVSNICHNLAYGSRNTESILQSIDSLKNAISNFENVTGDDLQQHLLERDAQKGRDGYWQGAKEWCPDEIIPEDEILTCANDYADSIRQGGAK